MPERDPRHRTSRSSVHLPAPALALAALLALGAPVALGGCYQIPTGEEEIESQDVDDTTRVEAIEDPLDVVEPDTSDESDLPGVIPPATGSDDGAPETGGDAGGGDDTDDEVERRSLTAFVGAESRGQYLTEQVAMCVQCHSPKDDLGQVIPERRFRGAPIPVESPYPTEWAVEAPPLVGMEIYTRDELVRLLSEGIARDGEPPRPPMPPFRMHPEDAAAIYDYLSNLPR